MATKRVSLLDFAKKYERPDCLVCILPEVEEIDGAYRSGVKRKAVLEWLWTECNYSDKNGYDDTGKVTGVTAFMLDKHFSGQHHHRKSTD